MTAWHEAKYKTGKPVAVPGFARPLYPPDAAPGKQPSVNGPDVEAAKRVAWRLGRWPGPASGFDRAYSNAFSHGKSGNAGETGMAGVQRQAGIDDTGFVGKATFDLMRSVLIPEGIPNGPGVAGSYACDAYAQSLFVEAWEQFGGQEPKPEPPPSETLRQKALKRAVTQIGTKEIPSGSNRTKYGRFYGMDGSPWCAMFICWSFETAGNSPSFRRGETYAYVPYMVSDARNYRNGMSVTKDPIPGDCVALDWHGDGVFDHVGLFVEWTNRDQGAYSTCEGNTSSDVHGDQSNGGEVCHKARNLRTASTVFIRVAEPG